jgi:membrane-associated phospholipid phosphatase
MNAKLATILSVIFHPVFIFLYGIISLVSLPYFFYFSFLAKAHVVLMAAMFTCIIPGFFLFVLYKTKYIDSMRVEKREQRHIIYIISIISYLTCLYLFWKMQMPYWVLLLLFCVFAAMLVMFIINICWKISIHGAAMGSFTGGVFFVSYLLGINPVSFFIVALLISALVMSARLQLEMHTMGQVVTGYLLGMFFTLFFPFLF